MPASFAAFFLAAARWALIALGAAISVSTAATNICAGLALIAWLLSGRVPAFLRQWRRFPPLGWLAALGLLLVAGSLSMLVTLAASLVAATGAVTFPVAIEFTLPHNHIVFKNHIAQNTLMALFAYGCLCLAMRMPPGWRRTLCLALGALAAIDVFALVVGRSGQVVLIALLLAWAARHLGRRGLAATIVGLPLALGALYLVSPSLQWRVERTLSEVETLDRPAAPGNSIGQRSSFLRESIHRVARRPLVGYGVGGVAGALTVPRGTDAAEGTHDVHNEYLRLALQAGLLAPLLLLGFQAGTLRWSGRGPPTLAIELLQGVTVAMMLSCLMNSAIANFTEGHAWAVLIGALVAWQGDNSGSPAARPDLHREER